MALRRTAWKALAGIAALVLLVAAVLVNPGETIDNPEYAAAVSGHDSVNVEARSANDEGSSEPLDASSSHRGASTLPNGSDAPPDAAKQPIATGSATLADAKMEKNGFETSKSGAPNDSADHAAPVGWNLGEDSAGSYALVTDSNTVWSGSRSAAVLPQSKEAEQGDIFMWQAIAAEPFRGQRLRFSAYVKIENVAGGAHLTMRAEDSSGRIVAFDNMSGRWIQGSTDWRPLELVVDVPESADVLIYGVGFIKPGLLWADEANLVQVDKTIKTTFPQISINHTNAPMEKRLILPTPFNLGFEIEAAGEN